MVPFESLGTVSY